MMSSKLKLTLSVGLVVLGSALLGSLLLASDPVDADPIQPRNLMVPSARKNVLLDLELLEEYGYDFNTQPQNATHFTWVSELPILKNTKNQNECGDCWAYAITGMLEAQLALKTGRQDIVLSAKQISECIEPNCEKGYHLDEGLTELSSMNISVDTEVNYKKSEGRACMADYLGVLKVNKTTYIPLVIQTREVLRHSVDINNIKKILKSYGPLAVGMDWPLNLGQYDQSKPVLEEFSCIEESEHEIGGHAVLLVGYQIREGTEYWEFKNSWGEKLKFFEIPVQRLINQSCIDFVELATIEIQKLPATPGLVPY